MGASVPPSFSAVLFSGMKINTRRDFGHQVEITDHTPAAIYLCHDEPSLTCLGRDFADQMIGYYTLWKYSLIHRTLQRANACWGKISFAREKSVCSGPERTASRASPYAGSARVRKWISPEIHKPFGARALQSFSHNNPGTRRSPPSLRSRDCGPSGASSSQDPKETAGDASKSLTFLP